MNNLEITITSKNQITLPIALVRKLGLKKNQVLQARIKNNMIQLVPAKRVEDVFKEFWAKHPPKNSMTTNEMKKTIRIGMAKHAR